MAYPHNSGAGIGSHRPQLPAFCRSRRPTLTVSVSSLAGLRHLLLLVLLMQLSTLLLVIAGPVPPRLTPAGATDPLRSPAVSSVTPPSRR